jgi:hypothetical protein
MNVSGGFRHALSERSFAMCFEYHERLAWIRRIEQMEKKLKEAELAKAAAGRKVAEGRQTEPQPDTQEQPVPA